MARKIVLPFTLLKLHSENVNKKTKKKNNKKKKKQKLAKTFRLFGYFKLKLN